MRKSLIIFALILAVNISKARPSGIDPTSFVDSVVNIFKGNTNSAIIVGIIRMPAGGQIETWKFTYGHLKRDTSISPPVNDSTLFQIGSITKTFTTTILSMLVNNGTISLYDTVQKFLPDSVHVPVYVNPVTNDTTIIRFMDLATHYAALPDEPHIGSGGMTTYQQMYDYLASYQLTYPPGQCFYYSDLGVALLGVSLQHILQDSIELLIPAMVCDTLDMYDSKIIGLTTSQLSRRAQGYKLDGGEASFILPNWPAYHGAGGLYSTLNDMMKYLQFAMQLSDAGMGNILDTVLLERRVANDSCQNPASIDSVGLAWQFAKLFPNNPKNHIRKVSKDGSTEGFCSYITFSTHPVTNLKTGVVMVTNWKNPGPLTNTAIEILKYLNDTDPIGIQNNSIATGYRLGQNYPNPFNPNTVISYTIPVAGHVTLKIYDMLGNEVAVPVDKKHDAGDYSFEWNGENFSSGIYHYKISAGEFVKTKRMVLIK